MSSRSPFIKNVAFAALTSLCAAACLGEAPLPPVEIFVPQITFVHQAAEAHELFDYVEGEETGFTVRLAADDAAAHGLPVEIAFVGAGGQNASAIAEMSAYEPGGKPIPQNFDCFGPIEVREAMGEVTVTVDDFCPAGDTPRLTIAGDISPGGDPRWAFDSPDGRVRTNFAE